MVKQPQIRQHYVNPIKKDFDQNYIYIYKLSPHLTQNMVRAILKANWLVLFRKTRGKIGIYSENDAKATIHCVVNAGFINITSCVYICNTGP